jgi:hypothetical protein
MATAMPTPTPTPPPTATPTIAPISLSCPSNTGVSTDFQDSFGAPTQTGGPIWQIAGLSLPDVVCSYQDPAHNAITITLADNFPTSDLNAVEQFLSTTNGTSTAGWSPRRVSLASIGLNIAKCAVRGRWTPSHYAHPPLISQPSSALLELSR